MEYWVVEHRSKSSGKLWQDERHDSQESAVAEARRFDDYLKANSNDEGYVVVRHVVSIDEEIAF